MKMEPLPGDDTVSSWSTENLITCIILGMAFVIGMPGNLSVIWVILQWVKQQSPTTVLILNLAIADFVVLTTLPLWIYSFTDAWHFGLPFCKLLTYIIYSCMYASIFFITVLGVERFVAVMYPLTLQKWRKKTVYLTVTFIMWVLAFLFGIPIIPVQELNDDERPQCTFRNYTSDQQEVACLLLETLVGFIIPYFIICTCYACIAIKLKTMACKSRRKCSMLIISIIVAFAVFWLPHHVFNVIAIISVVSNNTLEEETRNVVSEVGVYVSGALVFISSCINPILYAFAARKFQHSIRLKKIARLFEQLTQQSETYKGNEMSQMSRRTESSKQTLSSY
ncbi:leukotriene B4 receptor 1-like [Protopterus annectens]|uniref:leukotriene B4 receptor 1-like n=1 Tax=Protopterus annectens TaxID=7888 RepID=UPI001CFB605B|nr:leukotriene B4 receptor 1-like [Protopterus annectens]XP_043937987.1 leukotriene B4 receptor 1-like [Protopterus annectens]